MEYKTVTIGSLIQRKRLKAKNYKGSAQVYAVTNNRGFVKSKDLHDFQIHSEDTSNYSIVENNDFAYNPSRLNIGSIAYYQNEEAGMISPMYVVFGIDNSLVCPEYLFLLIRSSYVMQRIEGLKEEGARFRFDFKRWDNIEVKLPSLPEQKRIIEFLKNFSYVIVNLETEFASRQKQYEYYRNQLLAFDESDESIEWKTLKEISENCDKQRKPITSSKRVAGEYPYYGASGIVDYVEGYIFDGDYLLISEDGANLVARSTPIAFSISGKNWVNNHAHVIKFEHREIRRLVEIYLNSIDLSPWITGGAQPKLNQEKLNTIPLPVPSFEKQKEIVSILDAFESLITNIKNELEARKKQYEYYREKLLTFE